MVFDFSEAQNHLALLLYPITKTRNPDIKLNVSRNSLWDSYKIVQQACMATSTGSAPDAMAMAMPAAPANPVMVSMLKPGFSCISSSSPSATNT